VAGFQVIMSGRFWVFTEALGTEAKLTLLKGMWLAMQQVLNGLFC
jgi:hypothetical protein